MTYSSKWCLNERGINEQWKKRRGGIKGEMDQVEEMENEKTAWKNGEGKRGTTYQNPLNFRASLRNWFINRRSTGYRSAGKLHAECSH